jgi:hypothetical protein
VRAHQRGIGCVLNVPATMGSTETRKRPTDPSRGLSWSEIPLSAAQPANFKAVFAPLLAPERKVAGALYYSWAGHAGEVGSTIFRCGSLTASGKLALEPLGAE